MRTKRFRLTGLMPLLMHNDDVDAADRLKEWRKDPTNKNVSTAGDDRTPPWTWQTYLYSDGEHIVMPSCNIMVCVRQAATQIILKRPKTFKELSQSGMLIPREFCAFSAGGDPISISAIEGIRGLEFSRQSDAVRDMGFRLFVKRARVGTSKHIRVRPRFDTWLVEGEFNIYAKEITDTVLAEMLNLAGRVGLCDWRPGCKTPGPFGMFEAELFN